MIMFSSLRAALVLSVSAALVPVVRGSFLSMQGDEEGRHVEAEKTTSSELQTNLADEIQNAEAALQVWLGDPVGLGRVVVQIFTWGGLVLNIEISKRSVNV